MTALSPSRFTRRQVLVGGTATAGAVLLGACGDGGDDATTDTSEVTGAGLALAQFFGGPMFAAGTDLRLPFGVADKDGLLSAADTPQTLTIDVLDPDGEVLEQGIEVARHQAGLPRAYFPLRVTVEGAGFYTARTEYEGSTMEMSFQVHEAADLTIIQQGAAMPSVETPTTSAAHGVDPICTNDPLCPLHGTSLAEALAAGAPIALLISTPAFCQLAICGPVLDVMLGVTSDYPDVTFLHAEVYADPAEELDTYAPVVQELGLHFEPCLVLVGSDGNVTERVDVIYDDAELRDRLDALA